MTTYKTITDCKCIECKESRFPREITNENELCECMYCGDEMLIGHETELDGEDYKGWKLCGKCTEEFKTKAGEKNV